MNARAGQGHWDSTGNGNNACRRGGWTRAPWAVAVVLLMCATGAAMAFAARRAHHWTYYNGATYILRNGPFDVYDCQRAWRCAQKRVGRVGVQCNENGMLIEVPAAGEGVLYEIQCD